MVLRVIRLARIVRIAKLSRHSRNLNTLIKTMSTSLRELSFLLMFFIVSMVLYATFVYYCEQGYSPGADDSANEVGCWIRPKVLMFLVCLDSRILLVGYCDYDHCRLRWHVSSNTYGKSRRLHVRLDRSLMHRIACTFDRLKFSSTISGTYYKRLQTLLGSFEVSILNTKLPLD